MGGEIAPVLPDPQSLVRDGSVSPRAAAWWGQSVAPEINGLMPL
jgi:hypothetical protein